MKRDPWASPPHKNADIHAAKAFLNGTASETQQQRILDWLQFACGGLMERGATNETNETYYLQGRRSVIIDLYALSEAQLDPNEGNNARSSSPSTPPRNNGPGSFISRFVRR